MSKRTTIHTGLRWVRYLVALIAISPVLGAIQSSEGRQENILFALVCLLFFIIFHMWKRVSFDEENLYRHYGNRVRAIPLNTIFLIDRGPKVGSSHTWRVHYRGVEEKERKFIFREGLFRSGSIEALIEAVNVVKGGPIPVERSVLGSTLSADKRRRQKRKEKKEARSGKEGNDD